MTEEEWFPSMDDYVMSHRCSRCGAEPWVDCDAPRRQGRRRRDEAEDLFYGDPTPVRPRRQLQHTPRFDAGIRHYHRDLRKAPWPEGRVPGTNYGTVKFPEEGKA